MVIIHLVAINVLLINQSINQRGCIFTVSSDISINEVCTVLVVNKRFIINISICNHCTFVCGFVDIKMWVSMVGTPWGVFSDNHVVFHDNHAVTTMPIP